MAVDQISPSVQRRLNHPPPTPAALITIRAIPDPISQMIPQIIRPTNPANPPVPTSPTTLTTKPTAIRAIPTTATRAIPAATPVIPAATQAAPITPKTGTPEAPIVRHLPPRRIRLHRAVFGIRPWLRRNPMRPAPQPSAAGPAMTGLAWSNCGTVNPAGSGTRKTSHPAPTAYRSRCRPAKWPHSAPTIAMMPPCKSIGACGTSPNATAARP